jgi:uncharacterized protein (DUF302 family)
MLITMAADKTVGATAEALRCAVEANHYGVMQVHNLHETLIGKGVDFTRQCLIFEVCQPQQAKKVLDQDVSVSTVLPCRISVYEEGGKTIMAALKPTLLLSIFNLPHLETVAKEVEAAMTAIMQEAAQVDG